MIPLYLSDNDVSDDGRVVGRDCRRVRVHIRERESDTP